MTAKTFGAWLLDQEQVNYGTPISLVAGVWRETKGDTKIRSLPGVQNALETAGKLADPAIREGWDEAVAAWRQITMGQAALTVVPDAAQEQQELPLAANPGWITGDSSADLTRIYEATTGQVWTDPPSQLDIIEEKLDWLHQVLTKPAGSPFPPWPQRPAPAPINWAAAYQAADHDAQQEA